MRNSRLINAGVKLLVLVVAIGLLIHFWHATLAPPPPVGGGDNDEDDVKYAPRVPVTVAKIDRGDLHEYVTAYGTVEAEPGTTGKAPASATLRVPIASVVAEVDCVEGQHVEQGQPLFKLDSRPLKAAIESARRAVGIADDNLARSQEAAKDDKLAQQWVLRAQREHDLAQAELDRVTAQQALLTFTSPLAGTVVQLQIRPGETADASAPALVIVDLSRLVLATSVPGAQLKQIQIGQEAQIILQPSVSPPNATQSTAAATEPTMIAGTVRRIDAQVDSKTGLGSVDISIPAGAPLRLGAFAGARIVVATHSDCLIVPGTSIVRDVDGHPGISLAVRDFQWAFRHPVKVGITEGDRVEVEGEGLKAGEYIVTTGAYALPDKSRIDVGAGPHADVRGAATTQPVSAN